MAQLNEEQRVARILQRVNTLYAILTIIPGFFCFLVTIDALTPSQQCSDCWSTYYSTQDKFYWATSSILLIVFYGYTVFCPRIYVNEYYNRETTFNYWILVFITNLFTIILFISKIGFDHLDSLWLICVIPLIPLILSVRGMLAKNDMETDSSNYNVTQYGNK